MPKYIVTAPTGQEYDVDAPEGATGQDAIAYLNAQLGGVGAAIPGSESFENTLKRIEQERYAKGNALTQGLSRGVDIAQMGYGSALEGIGKGLGLKGLEEYGGEVVAEQGEELAAKGPYATRLKDVREAEGFFDTAGELASFAGSALGESLPQMGTTIGGSLAGAATGARMGAVAGIPGAVVGGIAGGLLANVPFFYGMNREAQKEAVADGTKIELNEGAAFLASIPQAVMDLIADRFLFGLGSKAGVNVEGLIRRGGLFTRGVKGAALGVTAEVPTEVGQQLIERFQAGRPIDSPEAIEEYFEVAAAAGLVGGSIRGATNIVGGDPEAKAEKLKKLEDKKLEDAKRELELGGGTAAPTGIGLAADEAAALAAAVTAAEERLTVAKNKEAELDAVFSDPNASATATLDTNNKKKDAASERENAQAALNNAKDAQGFAQFVQQNPELQNIGQQKRRELFKEYQARNKAQAGYASGDKTLQDLYTGFGIGTKGNVYIGTKLADITPEIAATIVNDFGKRKADLVEKGQAKNRVLAEELDRFTGSLVFQDILRRAGEAPAAASPVVTDAAETVVADAPAAASPVVTDADQDAVIPEGLQAGDKINIFDAAGNPYAATVIGVSKEGTVRVLNQAGKNVILDNDLSATTINVNNPAYTLESVGPEITNITLKSRAGLNELSEAKLVALESVLEQRVATFPPNQAAGRGALADLNAVKLRRKRNEAAASGTDSEAEAILKDRVVPAALKPRKGGKQSAYDEVTSGDNPLTLEDLNEETPTGANNRFTGTQLVNIWDKKKKGVKQPADRAPAAEEAARVAADIKATTYDDQKIKEIINDPIYASFIDGVRKSRQAATAAAKTDVDKALNKGADIVDSTELSAAALAAGIDTAGVTPGDMEGGPTAQGDIPPLTEEQLQQDFKEYVYHTFDPGLARLANRTYGTDLEALYEAAEVFYKKVIKLAEAKLTEEAAYSIAPETVTTPTSPEVMSAILSTRMGRDINDTVTIARNPQELGLTQLEPTAKGVVLDNRVYLFTDNIEAGNELGVFLHEVGSHVGMKSFVGEGNYNRLINTIKRFANKTDGSFESRLAKQAVDRLKLARNVVKKDNLPDDELLAYFIEEAVDAGVDPVEAGKDKSPIGNIFRSIMAAFKAAWRKLFSYQYDNPTAQEVVDMAYGAADLVVRNPTAMLSKIDKQLLYSLNTKGAQDWVESQGIIAASRDIGLAGVGKAQLEKLTGYKKYVYNFMGLLQLADQVSKKHPELAGLIRNIEGIVNRRKEVIDDKRREVEDFSIYLDTALNSEEYKPYREEFEDIVHESTIDEIDLRNTTDQTDPNRVVRDTDLYKRFEQLPAPLQEVYIRLANKYENFAVEYVATLEKFLDASGVSDAQKNVLGFLKGQITPYFPLLRHNGNYWLDFRVTNLRDASGALIMDDTGAPLVKRITLSYESPEQRLAAEQILRKDPDVEKGSVLSYARPNDASINSETPNADIEKLLGALTGDADLPASTKKLIVDNYLNMFPDSSLKKQFKKRKKIAGFRKDSIRNFAQIGHQMANQLASMQQSKELRDAFTALDEYQRTSAEPEGYIRSDDDSGATKADPNVAQIIQSIKDKRAFLENPQPKSWAALASWGSYVWYILGNLSSAFVNLSQVAIGYFHMVGRYGLVDTHKAYMNATKMYLTGGRDNNTKFKIPKALGFLAGFNTSLADKTFGANENLSPEYRALYDAGLTRGAVRRTTGQELVDMQKGIYKSDKGSFTQEFHKYNYALSWYFQNTERANREIALVAAYDLARKKGTAEIKAGSSEYGTKKGATDSKSAINYAVDFVDMINGPAIAETGPTTFQDGIGKVMGTFKRFAFSQVYLQYRLARDAVSHLDPEEKKIALKQIGAIMVPTWTMAGMKGLPFYGAAETFANMVMSDSLLGDEDEPWEFNTWANTKVGDTAFYGGFNKIFGTDVASRTGFGNMLFPYANPYKQEQLGVWYYPIAFAGPSAGIVEGWHNSLELFSEGQTLRGMEKWVPSFLRNPLKAARFSDLPYLGEGGALTRDGIPIMDPVPTGAILGNMFGFTPAKLAAQYKLNSSAKQYQRVVLDRRSGLLDKLYGAKVTGDSAEEDRVRREINKFNNSRFGREMPIEGSTEIRSFKARLKRSDEFINGLYLNKKLRDPILGDLGGEIT